MKQLFLPLFVLATLFSPALVQAKIEYRASIGANGIKWDNAVNVDTNGKVVLSWKDASSLALPTVKSWVPSTFVVPPTKGIQFVGNSASGNKETVTLPSFKVLGMQYNTIGISKTLSSSGLGSCDYEQMSGSLVDVRGDNCFASQKLDYDKLTAPFILYRPIISINDTELLDALEGKNKGIYTASVPISVKVPYYVGSVLSYRQFNEVIIIVVDYDPVWITQVTLNPEDVTLEPVYDSTSRMLSSLEKSVKVTVDGYFNNGIRFSLLDNDYFLENESNLKIKVPFYINCRACGLNQNELKQLVDMNGTVINPWVTIGSGISLINDPIQFELVFGYTNIDGTDLITGNYRDTVNFSIEPEM